MNEKGSVLLHVLVTAALVALIGASILRLSLMRALVASHTINSNAGERSSESAINSLFAYWNTVNTVCANPGGGSWGYSCSGPVGSCGCTCTGAATSPTVYTCPADGAACDGTTLSRGGPAPCQVSAVAPDPVGTSIY